mmetsp:Transcript_7547/g.11198  ORF Transcript_7547/g.11198 Transcript_7547/m.11198 type:complete len:604 (-) Transcript_7547:179-1990(-)|eukprot:CAMPEP_0185030884 /NCGR_PEP_ID=MMETSP1103-20130426/18014_1 /TAXON_ID=36769 /ORGANISM="Paraphysomonas bandaiensis, Strain Caron Lab Isolate" /LENGTH=603 /DNA_ID=CAMNT_0027566181 /DNA_START=51 /DNA_END=1862 /DNA_ORIENTATION=+
MRPNSRGTGTASGPPGTGARPGSGRRPPGTASRLRTGVAPTGPGMQAAQGVSLSASINVSDRPVTGQGVMGMKTQGQGPGRLVQDPAYYVGLLRKKINEVGNETRRLQEEIDQQNRDKSQLGQLEKRYESLIKNKESLEGQLADYNLALDKTRTSTDVDDVQQMALQLGEKNRQMGQELDRIFMLRRQREAETTKIEESINAHYQAVQKRINELEPGKLRAYNDLLERQRSLQDQLSNAEARLHEVNGEIARLEEDEKGYSHRKEFANLEKQLTSAKRNYDSLSEEYDIAMLDPKEAHAKFVARVNDHKQNTKFMDSKASSLRSEIKNLKQQLEELSNTAISQSEEDSSEAAKYDLLMKRDQEMTAFMDKFDETRSGVMAEQENAKSLVVGLLEHIGRGLDDATNLPDAGVMGEMEDAKAFKERNLATAQKTMESLQAERVKREKELEMLRSSEPKLLREISGLKESMARMNEEMKEFSNIEAMQRKFERTQRELQELRKSYIKRKDATRQQVQALSAEHESLKKMLASNDTDRDLEDTEKRLKHYERTIFEAREFIESKTRETDYELVKGTCMRMTDTINTTAIKLAMEGGNNNPSGGAGRW